jgi:chorismate mutase / prephenate dehydratase
MTDSSQSSKGDIKRSRDRIDEIDLQIIDLLSQRALQAKNIGDYKRANNLLLHVPDRERAVVERLKQSASDDLPATAIVSIFREIMSACLRLEEPLAVACLGPGTTFSCLAAQKSFGAGINIVSEPTFAQVFEAVQLGRANYGVVPIENSSEGAVNTTLQLLLYADLKIAAQIFMKVEQNLCSRETNLSNIKRVYSHPQALGQCRSWLHHHLPWAELIETNSTAQASQLTENANECGAICSVAASLEYNLPLLRKNIHDAVGNETRFLILSKSHMFSARPDDNTTMVFGVSDSFGQLAKVLNIFSHAGINLSKIQNIPDGLKPWNAFFWVDVPAAGADANFQNALRELESATTYLNVLGSYPTLPG